MAKNTQKRRYNNYSLSIILSVLAGLILSLVLIFTAHLASGALPEWLYQLIFSLLCISQVVSGTGYSFTGFDILFNEKTIFQIKKKTFKQKLSQFFKLSKKPFKKRKVELVGLILGFIVAIGVTAYLVAQNAASIVANNIPVIGPVIFFITNVGFISGLCSRVGRCIDYFRINPSKKEKRLASGFRKENEPNVFRGENINYVISVLIGVVIGIVLAGLFLGFAGVTSVMTAGGAVPLWVGAVVFVLATISGSASAAGYIGRIFDFFLGERTLGMRFSSFYVKKSKSGVEKVKTNDTVWKGIKRRADAERVGTLIGVSIGIILGIVLITTGLAMMPFFGMGLPAAAAGVIVMISCIGGLGGLGNRIGFFIVKLQGKKSDAEHVANTGSGIEAETSDDEALKQQVVEQKRPLLSESKSFNDFGTLDADDAQRTPFVDRMGKLLGGPSEGSDESGEKYFDSGRREPHTPNVEPRFNPSRVPSIRSAGCAFFTKTHSETVSRFNPTRLDVTWDEWNRLRQKAEDRQSDTAHTHHNANSAGGRREQDKGTGNSGRLHLEAILTKGIDRADQNGVTAWASPAA